MIVKSSEIVEVECDYVIVPEAHNNSSGHPRLTFSITNISSTSRLPLYHQPHILLFKMGSHGDVSVFCSWQSLRTFCWQDLRFQFHASTGITPPKGPVSYSTYKSPYGPKYNARLPKEENWDWWTRRYKIQPHIAGWTPKAASKVYVDFFWTGTIFIHRAVWNLELRYHTFRWYISCYTSGWQNWVWNLANSGMQWPYFSRIWCYSWILRSFLLLRHP